MDTNKAINAARAQRLVRWNLWFAMTAGMALMYYFLILGTPPAEKVVDEGSMPYLPLIPLVISVIIRFKVLPWAMTRAKEIALGVFIAGLATAEMCGHFAIFLMMEPVTRDFWMILCMIALFAYMPLFLPKPQLQG